MTKNLLIIAGLGISYYLFTKISSKKITSLPEKSIQYTTKTIPKKTLSISSVINKPITKSISIIGAPSQIPTDVIELERQNVLADIARTAGLAQAAARIEAETTAGKAKAQAEWNVMAARNIAKVARKVELDRQDAIYQTALAGREANEAAYAEVDTPYGKAKAAIEWAKIVAVNTAKRAENAWDRMAARNTAKVNYKAGNISLAEYNNIMEVNK